MVVFGYVRVSSIEQERGFGPDVQEADIRAYCTDKGLSAPTIVRESVSGESLAARKELLAILKEAKARAAEGDEAHIVFRSSDRLARSLTDQEPVVLASFQMGFRLHSTMSHEADLFDPAYAADPMRTAMRQIFGAFNQLERAIIQGRLDSGLHAKAAEGGSTGGRYAFGYQGINNEITVVPEEAPAVKRLFELEHAGLDLRSTAVVLGREFPSLCGHWTATHVHRALAKRMLYQHGHYKPRLSPQTFIRPELIVAPPLKPEHVPEPRLAGEPVDWSTIPDPVPAYMLAILLAKTAAWVQYEVKRLALKTKLVRGKTVLPHDSARTLESVSKSNA
jgi:DNA invertase Pin-like site-specific DNA recombinase